MPINQFSFITLNRRIASGLTPIPDRRFLFCLKRQYLESILVLPQPKLRCPIRVTNDIVRIVDEVANVN